MDKKTIQKRRMMGYFIEATQKIMDAEGLHAVTVRKVANLAGYNISTIYNYFNNLDHLVFYASMKYFRDYVFDLPNYVSGAKDSLEIYRLVWQCYCKHSFARPKIFYILFWDKYRQTLKESITEYYNIFPEDLGRVPSRLLPMLLEGDIYKRDMVNLSDCAADGFFKPEDIDTLNEMFLLVYQSMLLRIVKEEVDYTVEDAAAKTLYYQDKIIESFRIK